MTVTSDTSIKSPEKRDEETNQGSSFDPSGNLFGSVGGSSYDETIPTATTTQPLVQPPPETVVTEPKVNEDAPPPTPPPPPVELKECHVQLEQIPKKKAEAPPLPPKLPKPEVLLNRARRARLTSGLKVLSNQLKY